MKNSILTIITWIFVLLSIDAQNIKVKKELPDTTIQTQVVIISSKRLTKAKVLKLDVPTKFLPISTNQISAKTLNTFGIQDIQQAAKFLPNVRINTSYGGFQQICMRGFDHSVIMIDGIRDERSSIDNSYPFPDLSSIESIELLKGPASVLYGQSAVGGVINITRKAAEAKQSVNAKLSYGSYNYKQATMGMGGQLIGPVNYQANLNFSNQDGWRQTGNKRFSGYFTLGSKIGTNGVIDVRGGFNSDFYGTEIGLPANMTTDIYQSDGKLFLATGEMQKGLNKTARYNNQSDFLKNKSWNLSAQYSHQFGNNTKMTEKLSYSNDDIDYFSTESLSYLESSNPIYSHYYTNEKNKKQYICLDTVQLNSPLRFSHMAETINNQIELSGKFKTGSITHNYLGGYSFIALLRNSYSGYNLGKDVTGPGLYSKVPINNPHSMGYMDATFSKANVMKTYTHGIYFQDLLDISEQFKLYLAGRFDSFNYQRAIAKTNNGVRDFNTPQKNEFEKVKSSSFTYRTGFVYLPKPSISFYGSIGTFFKPYRTFYNENTIYIDSNGKEFSPTKNEEIFKPEKGYQVEIGSRHILNSIMEVNTSLFYIKKYNTVKTLAMKGDIINSGSNTIKLEKNISGQVGTMDSKGFDIDLTLTPCKEYFVTLGYGYTDARTRSIKDNDYLKSDILTGTKNAYTPSNTFYAYSGYQFVKGLLKGIALNANITYMDKVCRNIKSNLFYPSYWLADFSASYTLKNKVLLSLNINNVFNKEYYNQSLGNQMVPSMPRNFLISIAYKL